MSAHQIHEDRSSTLEENLPAIWVEVPEFGALGGPNVKKRLRDFVIKNPRNAFRIEVAIKMIELMRI